MQITLGQFALSLERKASQARPDASNAVLVSMDNPRQPFLFDRYDNPRLNMSFIRETVAACMHARSEAVSRGMFHAYAEARGPSGKPIKRALDASHPLESLLRNPNPIFDMSDLLELSNQWLDATGNALWLKVRNGHGEVAELWPVAAMHYYIERGADEMPSYYRFVQSNVRVPASDIIHIRRADIRTAPFHGHALLTDILETAKADTAIRLFQSRFFDNDATPRTVITFPPGAMITQNQIDQLRSSWEAKYGSPMNAGKIGILADGGDVKTVGSGAKELDFAKSKKELRDAIREAFKVPQVVLGDVEGVNLANAETSYMVFMRDVVDYALQKHARALTRGLRSEFTGFDRIEHEPVVSETEEAFMLRVQQLKECMTVDEQRALLELPPLPANGGNVFVLDHGSSVLGSDWQPLAHIGNNPVEVQVPA